MNCTASSRAPYNLLVAYPQALPFGMRRRTLYDPLQPITAPTWLVVRNKYSAPLEWREIASGADLRAILQAARSERIGAGWLCDDIGRACSCFFAARSGERLQVCVERYNPAGPGPPGHSDRRTDAG